MCFKFFNFIILLLLFSVAAAPAQPVPQWFEPANKVDVVVLSQATFDPLVEQFNFAYTLGSKSDSQEDVDNFSITVGEKQGFDRNGVFFMKGILSIQSPSQWDWMRFEKGDFKSPEVGWFPAAIEVLNDITMFLPDPASILPGQTLSGFNLAASNLPGVRTFWVKGFVPPPPSEDAIVNYVNANYGTDYGGWDDIPVSIKVKLFPSNLVNAVSGKTVGPDVLPTNITNDQLLDRLISLKEQAFNLGWIDNQGVANSLDAKLNEVKVKLQAGQTKVAGNILKSFILDLIAQHVGQTGQGTGQGNPQGKHVNDNAFYLLKPNAEFILYKLGQL